MRYSCYPEYVATRWSEVGNIPSDWEARRLKFAVSVRNEKIEALDAEFEYMGLEHIESWTGKRIEDGTAASEGVATRFEKDDVLFGKLRPYLAKVYLADREGMATTEVLVLTPQPVLVPAFLKYLMLSDKFIDSVSGSTYGAKMPRANWEAIGSLPILLPSRNEQQKIAAFLDWKSGQIDALIAKKTELLDKLEEKRQTIIAQAVTKGLNLSVPLRESKIPWLGTIPEHWVIKRGRFVMRVNPLVPRLRTLRPDEEVSFIPMEAVGVQGGINLEQTRAISEVSSSYTEFQDGDVVVAKITPCFENGKAALAVGLMNGVAYGTTELHVLRAEPELDKRFLFYVTISDTFLKLGESEMYGAGGQKRVPPEFVKDFRIPLPPLVEQIAIADYLDSEVSELDVMGDKVQEAIERLTEYRTALITAATLGKIDVRNVKIGAAI